MSLIKELLSKADLASTPVKETEHWDIAAERQRLDIWKVVDRDLDHLNAIVKDNSNFVNLVAKLGGEPHLIKEAREHLKKFEDVMLNVRMSVGAGSKR